MEMEMEKGMVLVVGGSGYLGLHLLQAFAAKNEFRFCYTFSTTHKRPCHPLLHGIQGFRVDLRTGEGLAEIYKCVGSPAVVVNCAAISIPRECEENPEEADVINVPRTLVEWLKSFAPKMPLLIQLSTDQVYDGTKSFYKETDQTNPVNVYGKTKVEAEKYIHAHWKNYAILRSSIIYGPHPAVQLSRTLPIQWIDSMLATGMKMDFFADEFRCPVYVMDVVEVVFLLIASSTAEEKSAQISLNVGGPDRLSRAGMAEVVAAIRGYQLSLINHSKASSVNRGVKSPPDISMDISKLESLLNFTPTKFADGVWQTFHATPFVPTKEGATGE